MSGRRKRIEALRARPVEMNFSELVTILTEDFGFIHRRTTGSHHIYKSPVYGRLSIPTVGGRKVKGVYLDEICELLGLDDMDLNTFD
ncbi:MAG TPA: type II toxin-antitoxin system HicA family toxin [Thermomicrobiales bacterium]|jgi:predicted RNA binding protein YcfA (HicA-like mRNA interferase family)|nr:type II toxin-antitoxin system HicA family toxin [Thermomicrobiales bacterium]